MEIVPYKYSHKVICPRLYQMFSATKKAIAFQTEWKWVKARGQLRNNEDYKVIHVDEWAHIFCGDPLAADPFQKKWSHCLQGYMH